MLSFLAVAARAHLDVVAYRDDAEADMPESGPMALREIRLHPVITLRGTVSEERIRQLVEVAHRECFIANTLRCPVVVVPTVVTT